VVSTDSVTFTPDDWNIPQLVTVTGVDDDLKDGDAQFAVLTSWSISADVRYHGINPADVAVTNLDDPTDLPLLAELNFDVNRDGRVSPIDALLVINRLNDKAAALAASALQDLAWQNEFDVNRDGRISPLDALLVINELNRRNRKRVEQPDAPPAAAAEPTASVSGDVVLVEASARRDAGDAKSQAERDAWFARAAATGIDMLDRPELESVVSDLAKRRALRR
jgi:hypothetical protein